MAHFDAVRARLKGMPAAYTAEQIAAQNKRGGFNNAGAPEATATTGRIVRVPAPSGSFRTYQPSAGLRVSVPSNWMQVDAGQNSVTYAPDGAWFTDDRTASSAFTHGVEIGVAQGTGNLQNDTKALLRSLSQGNPRIQQSGQARNDTVAGSEVALSTTELNNGPMLYVIGVAPRTEAAVYEGPFRRVRQQIQLADR